MHAGLLKEYLTLIIESDASSGVQKALSQLHKSLNELASAPHEPTHQQNVAQHLAALSKTVQSFQRTLSHQDIKRLAEFEVQGLFSTTLVSDIKEAIADNVVSPVVAKDAVAKLTQKRNEFLSTAREIVERLDKLGIRADTLLPGEAQIGFKIPREVFDNNLNGIIKELKEINFTIRTFSEIVTGAAEEVKVGNISTTDPLIYFGLSVPTIITIGQVIDWVLDRWKKVEEIRHIRAQTKKLESFNKDDIAAFFDDKIKKQIDLDIGKKIAELLKQYKGDKGRQEELKTSLENTLRYLFSRIERGMTVEVRFLPPPQVSSEEEKGDADPNFPNDDLSALRNELNFPAPSQSPILSLTGNVRDDDNDDEENSS